MTGDVMSFIEIVNAMITLFKQFVLNSLSVEMFFPQNLFGKCSLFCHKSIHTDNPCDFEQ